MSPSDVKQAFLPNREKGRGSPARPEQEDKAPAVDRGFTHRWRSSWQAPTTMIGFLLLGGAMAVGHHCFYLSLDGTTTPNNFSQQLNIAYGTAFAFVAKACMVAAVVSAYTQYIWSDFRKKLITISTIDSTFTATTSIVSMLDPRFLWTCKTGAILAALVWSLPVSAIVTPSTLSVRPTAESKTIDQAVPTLNFSTFEQFEDGYTVKAPLNRLSKLVTASVQIPPIQPFIANSSYTIEFMGPSLQCGAPTADVVQNIDAIFEATGGMLIDKNNNPRQLAVYIAFTPFTPKTDDTLPWPLDDIGEVRTNSSDWSNFVELCLKGTRPNCSLFAPTMRGIPVNSTIGWGKTIDTTNALWLRFGDERLACSVQKTRYRLDFDAHNPLTALKSYSYIQKGAFASDSSENAGSIVAIQPVLDILRGSTWIHGKWCYLSEMQSEKCETSLSYLTSQTSVHETALTAMLYEKAGEIRNKTWEIAQNFEQGVAPPKNDPIPVADPRDIPLTRNLSLREIIEEMSRNVTLSYFSDARYLSADRTYAAVTITNSVNIYHYNMRNLVLAYSIAFGTSALAVVLGLRVFIANGYLNCTTNFSTVLCATIRNPDLGNLIEGSTNTQDAKIKSSSMIASPDVLKLGLKFGALIDDHVSDTERTDTPNIQAFGTPGQVL